MSQTRREVLGATVAIGTTSISYACGTKTPGDGDTGAADSGGTPAPERSAEPAPWTPPGDLDNEAFPSGIQTGDPTPDSVQLSLWTTVEQAELVLLEAQSSGWQEVRRFEGLVPANGHVAIGIDGLDADVAYTIAALDPVMGGWSRPARFRTAVDDEGWRVIEFGATSCLGGNEPWATLQHAADDRLDFFVL